jgi:hypothetical protein
MGLVVIVFDGYILVVVGVSPGLLVVSCVCGAVRYWWSWVGRFVLGHHESALMGAQENLAWRDCGTGDFNLDFARRRRRSHRRTFKFREKGSVTTCSWPR